MQLELPWRKAQVKLEGEEEYEALDKFERLEVYQDHIRYFTLFFGADENILDEIIKRHVMIIFPDCLLIRWWLLPLHEAIMNLRRQRHEVLSCKLEL